MSEQNESVVLPNTETSQEDQNTDVKPNLPKESSGKFAVTLGRGEDAKNSIVVITILCAFAVGCLFSLAIVANLWAYPRNPDANMGNEIKNIWETVIPLITLSLGYAFGKAKD